MIEQKRRTLRLNIISLVLQGTLYSFPRSNLVDRICGAFICTYLVRNKIDLDNLRKELSGQIYIDSITDKKIRKELLKTRIRSQLSKKDSWFNSIMSILSEEYFRYIDYMDKFELLKVTSLMYTHLKRQADFERKFDEQYIKIGSGYVFNRFKNLV